MVVCCGCQTVDQRTGVDSDPDGLEIQAGGGGGGGGRGGGFVERKRIEIGDVVNTKCTKYVYIDTCTHTNPCPRPHHGALHIQACGRGLSVLPCVVGLWWCRCGGSGHMSFECRNAGQKYAFVDDEDKPRAAAVQHIICVAHSRERGRKASV
jgi:hypothetical protein